MTVWSGSLPSSPLAATATCTCPTTPASSTTSPSTSPASDSASPPETTMRRRWGGPVDVIVFGDTHVAHLSHFKGVLLVNPGSPTFPSNYDRQHGTVGILTIENGLPRAELLPLSEHARRFLPKT